MISFVKGKPEISHNLPNPLVALFLLLKAVQSFKYFQAVCTVMRPDIHLLYM